MRRRREAIDRRHVVADLHRRQIRVKHDHCVIQGEGRGNLKVEPVVVHHAGRVVVIGVHPIQSADDIGAQGGVARRGRALHRVAQGHGPQAAEGAANVARIRGEVWIGAPEIGAVAGRDERVGIGTRGRFDGRDPGRIERVVLAEVRALREHVLPLQAQCVELIGARDKNGGENRHRHHQLGIARREHESGFCARACLARFVGRFL